MLALRTERIKRGWSLVALCQRTGIAPGDLSGIERGVRQAFPGWKKRIAQAFKMSEADLFQTVDDDV